jgi:hypothetical protein
MAKVLPTPQEVRDLSISGEFALVTDATIIDIRDAEAAPVYAAEDVTAHTQWTRVVALHTAHILHVLLKIENAGGNWGVLAGVSSRALQGVGSRGYAVGALNPADLADLMKIPSPYLARLNRILETFPPSVHTTGGI